MCALDRYQHAIILQHSPPITGLGDRRDEKSRFKTELMCADGSAEVNRGAEEQTMSGG